MMDRNRLAARALTVFLFLTGGSALVYQVLWSRYLGLLLGSSAVAVVVVLAAFMGGLAIGSWTFGRIADRPIRRLSLYAWLEIGVGVYCALFPVLMAALEGPYVRLVAPLHTASPATFTAARLLFAALLLVPPTILMGGTMPAASRFLLGLEPGVRKAVARLYWVNSLGAVTGALVAGFWLIPALGLDLSMDIAAAVNVIVGVSAIALRTRIGEDPTANAHEDPQEKPLGVRAARASLAAITVSGFAALVVEVAWTRLLALVLGSSTYAFALMVATFILGIALGSRLVGSQRFAARDPVSLLAGCLAAVAVLLAVSLPFYPALPWLFHRLRSYVNPIPEAYPLLQGLFFVTCALVMLAPTIAMGATLPLASRIATQAPAALGRRVGLTWALNTMGTLLGALLAGLVFLPRIGLQGTFSLVTALYGVASILALLGMAAPIPRRAIAVGVAAVTAAAAVPLLPAWPMQQLVHGDYRNRGRVPPFRKWVSSKGSVQVLSHVDGATCSVTVTQETAQKVLMLRVNGKPDASTGVDMPTQVISGHLAAFLSRPQAARALVVGIGSGATVGALATHPGLQVTAVEIEPAVVAAAREHFAAINERYFENPRVQVVVEDAKTIFRLAREKWDIIVSEPSNPWVAGISGLFTRDYFEQARSSLAPGGVMVQWMHTYEMDDDSARLILRTFRAVFRHATVWETGANDYVLVGSEKPLAVDARLLDERFAVPEVQKSLARVNVTGVHGLLARQVLSTPGLALVAGAGALNSDQFPALEYGAPRGFFVGTGSLVIAQADERGRLGSRPLLFREYVAQRPVDSARAVEVARSLQSLNPRLQLAALWEASRLAPRDAQVSARFVKAMGLAGAAEAEDALRTMPAGAARRDLLQAGFAAAADQCRATRSSLFPAPGCERAVRFGEELARVEDRVEQRLEAAAGLGNVYLWAGKPERSLESAKALLAANPGAPPARRAAWLEASAMSQFLLGREDEAKRTATEALSLNPSLPAARRILGLVSEEPEDAPRAPSAPSSPGPR